MLEPSEEKTREEQEKEAWDVLQRARSSHLDDIEELAYKRLLEVSTSHTAMRIIYDSCRDPSTKKQAEEKYYQISKH